MNVEQKKSKLIEDLVYQNGKINCKLAMKNIKIADRLRELSITRHYITDPETDRLIKSEIDWLTELADI